MGEVINITIGKHNKQAKKYAYSIYNYNCMNSLSIKIYSMYNYCLANFNVIFETYEICN